ncbi:hypothetical protein IV203_019273 [Nitzschia inconspicua]|uniref:Uncharacterized protein n=1 Tax=Nitzschia inconspicua TaxID=303405 RepID=A0A9K3LY51_9STRA|nr:hypothetical protein IV203_019273 [Nitzschia inconspicua]
MIIRDGFPALHTPGSKTFQPNLKDEEPIPRHTFWFHENAIQFHPNHLESLRHDCETVFTARDKPDGAAYSAGQTFFLPANKSPRCALEALTIMIFQKHTEHLPPGTFNPNISGANWWTLVMDNDDDDGINEKGGGTTETSKDHEESTEGNDDDEVGLHFDADYELEEQTTNILLHPRVATVTYLSDYGAPTAIFNLKSPSMDDVERKALEKPIDKAWLSHPQVGKHTAFDGRLLHGAPGLYFPSRRNNTTTVTTDVEPPVKRQKVDTANRKRYTLLVNVWLNHWVMDAALLDEEVCAQMKTPWEDPNSILKQGDSYTPPFSWNAAADLSKPSQISSKVKLEPSSVDPAGEDDITLCNHHVTVRYNPLMAECHGASNQSSTVELELARDAIQLEVGDALEDDGGEQGKS